MAREDVGVGIDVSKDTLELAIDGKMGSTTFPNSAAGIEALTECLRDVKVHRVVLEPSGGYERAALVALHGAEMPVVLVEPARARYFAKGLGKRAKTDAIDAAMLARMAAVGVDDSPMWVPLEDALADIGALIERRRLLVRIRDAETKRLRLVRELVRADIEASIAALTVRIEAFNEQIEDLVAASPSVEARVAVLKQVKGVGSLTATSLAFMLPELGKVDRGEIAALVGVAPMNRDSGKWSGQRYIRGGRADARSVLYMATLTGIRCNTELKARYNHLKQKGKKSKVAIVACMRKLLTHLNSLMRAQLAAAAQ